VFLFQRARLRSGAKKPGAQARARATSSPALERISWIRIQPPVWVSSAPLWFYKGLNFACHVLLEHFTFYTKKFNPTILLVPDQKYDFSKLVKFGY